MFEYVRCLIKNYGVFYYRIVISIVIATFFPYLYRMIFGKELGRYDIVVRGIKFSLFEYIAFVSTAILISVFILHYIACSQKSMGVQFNEDTGSDK